MKDSFRSLIDYIEQQTAFHCGYYKERPLKRRIRVRMRALDCTDFSSYHDYLRENPHEAKKLLSSLTINLSYFFRNPETFEYLRKEIIPGLKRQKDAPVFWSAGCARGEEPYSLAITALETRLSHRIIIYGTDIDGEALSFAEKGIYAEPILQYTPEDIKQRYFRNKNNDWILTEKIRTMVRFMHFDLFDEPTFEQCDVIMCRNVLIYLDRVAQSQVLKNFYNHLRPGGYLIIGKVELLIGLPEVKLFDVVSRTEHVYQKKKQ